MSYVSKTYSVRVVQNKKGWYIAIEMNGVPQQSLGPYEEKLTVPDALKVLAMAMILDPEKWGVE